MSHSENNPLFTDFKFHNTGIATIDALYQNILVSVPKAAGTELTLLAHSEDFSELGRFAVTREQVDIGAFKTPTLRDVELTSPYMHNGSLKTLIEVVQFYNGGGNSNSNLGNNILGSYGPGMSQFGRFQPYQIVSLLDMIELKLRDLIDLCFIRLRILEKRAQQRKPLTPEEQDGFLYWINQIDLMCREYEIDASYYVSRVNQKLRDPDRFTPSLSSLLSELKSGINNELRSRLFMFIPQEQAVRYDQERPFGDKVFRQLPAARRDITEAGNCYATGNWTAAVFHLMRVVEHGLRAMAKRLRVRFPKNPKTLAELHEWRDIIVEINRKVIAIENKKRTLKREADAQFYSGAASQFHHFKAAWRNHVMHTRQSYDSTDALVVLRHVEEFMQHLATKFEEKRVKTDSGESEALVEAVEVSSYLFSPEEVAELYVDRANHLSVEVQSDGGTLPGDSNE